MKIEIEELDSGVIGINNGKQSVSIVEAVKTLDFHLARNAIRAFTEMLNRHLGRTCKRCSKGRTDDIDSDVCGTCADDLRADKEARAIDEAYKGTRKAT